MPRSLTQTISVTEARGRKDVPIAITVGVTPTQLAPFSSKRIGFRIYNNSQVAVYIGRNVGPTVNNGFVVPAASAFEDNVSYDEWYGIVATGSADVRVEIVSLDV